MNLQNVILLVSSLSVKQLMAFLLRRKGGQLGGWTRRRDGRVLSWAWVGKLGF